MTRIVILGSGSFIARAMTKIAVERGITHVTLPHDAHPEEFTPDDCIINFALAPAYRTGPYDQAKDCDLQAAIAAARAGAAFLMLSTRRVYGPDARWDAREAQKVSGDETAYGQNKAHTESAVQDVLEGRAGIFRLSNVIGYEYDREVPRRSFLGILLESLKKKNTIFLDMSPSTRRDFLPVELCARLLLDRALARTSGIYNLGSGVALACGNLAGWIREGYGGGEMVCNPDIVRDEFSLCMDKWRAEFPLPINEKILRDYCIGLGGRLKCEKS